MARVYTFYGVDLDELRRIYGSNDWTLADQLIKAQADELQNVDDRFGNDGPRAETILREIIKGECCQPESAWRMYVDVLEILCDHIGDFIEDGVGSLREHIYNPQILTSGPPVSIPVNPADGHQVGFVPHRELQFESEQIGASPKRAQRHLRLNLWALLHGKLYSEYESDAVVADDKAAYREILETALTKGVSLVAYRCF